MVVQPIAAVPEREIRDRSLPEQAQDPIGVCGPEGRARALEEDEASRGEDHPGDGEQLLLAERESVVPVPLDVQAAHSLQHALQAQFPQQVADLLVPDGAIPSRRQQHVPEAPIGT